MGRGQSQQEQAGTQLRAHLLKEVDKTATLTDSEMDQVVADKVRLFFTAEQLNGARLQSLIPIARAKAKELFKPGEGMDMTAPAKEIEGAIRQAIGAGLTSKQLEKLSLIAFSASLETEDAKDVLEAPIAVVGAETRQQLMDELGISAIKAHDLTERFVGIGAEALHQDFQENGEGHAKERAIWDMAQRIAMLGKGEFLDDLEPSVQQQYNQLAGKLLERIYIAESEYVTESEASKTKVEDLTQEQLDNDYARYWEYKERAKGAEGVIEDFSAIIENNSDRDPAELQAEFKRMIKAWRYDIYPEYWETQRATNPDTLLP